MFASNALGRPEYYGYNRKIPGWGKVIEGRHVLVLNTFGRCPYTAWRIYLDGDLIYDMLEATNERAAKHTAEVYMKSEKLQYIVKFENAMNGILGQYEKERTNGTVCTLVAKG